MFVESFEFVSKNIAKFNTLGSNEKVRTMLRLLREEFPEHPIIPIEQEIDKPVSSINIRTLGHILVGMLQYHYKKNGNGFRICFTNEEYFEWVKGEESRMVSKLLGPSYNDSSSLRKGILHACAALFHDNLEIPMSDRKFGISKLNGWGTSIESTAASIGYRILDTHAPNIMEYLETKGWVDALTEFPVSEAELQTRGEYLVPDKIKGVRLGKAIRLLVKEFCRIIEIPFVESVYNSIANGWSYDKDTKCPLLYSSALYDSQSSPYFVSHEWMPLTASYNSKTYYAYLTRDADYEDAVSSKSFGFGDNGSCFITEGKQHDYMRAAIRDNGLIVRIFDSPVENPLDFDIIEKHGVARCIIMPNTGWGDAGFTFFNWYQNYKQRDRMFLFDSECEEVYQSNMFVTAKSILKAMLGAEWSNHLYVDPYYCKGHPCGNGYMNDGNCVIVKSNKSAAPSSYMIDVSDYVEEMVECAECGTELREGDAHFDDDNYYCHSCINHCQDCDCRINANRQYCRDCHSNHFVECEITGEEVDIAEIAEVTAEPGFDDDTFHISPDAIDLANDVNDGAAPTLRWLISSDNTYCVFFQHSLRTLADRARMGLHDWVEANRPRDAESPYRVDQSFVRCSGSGELIPEVSDNPRDVYYTVPICFITKTLGDVLGMFPLGVSRFLRDAMAVDNRRTRGYGSRGYQALDDSHIHLSQRWIDWLISSDFAALVGIPNNELCMMREIGLVIQNALQERAEEITPLHQAHVGERRKQLNLPTMA